MTELELLRKALTEDAPDGDITCIALSKADAPLDHGSSGNIIAKQDLIFSGAKFLSAVQELHQHFPNLSPISVELFIKDSDSLVKGDKIATLKGHYADLLLIERSLLNIVGRMCGVATLTNKFVKKVSHTDCKILDTRKTTPLYRHFEKQAVLHGGGQNHRMDLSDAIMLKENHLKSSTLDIKDLISQIRTHYPDKKIILEVENQVQLEQAIQTPVNQILLDNMSTEQIATSVRKIPAHIKSEASGNMTLDRVSEVAETGVQFISIGLITHSAPWADISFLLD